MLLLLFSLLLLIFFDCDLLRLRLALFLSPFTFWLTFIGFDFVLHDFFSFFFGQNKTKISIL